MQLTSDGHAAYFSSVEEAFGADIDYSMLIKLYWAAAKIVHQHQGKLGIPPADQVANQRLTRAVDRGPTDLELSRMNFICIQVVGGKKLKKLTKESKGYIVSFRHVENGMSEQHTTPLARLYQEMVDAHLIVPVAEPGRFTYPSMRIRVPSVTTYDTRGLGEELRAQLERRSPRDQFNDPRS